MREPADRIPAPPVRPGVLLLVGLVLFVVTTAGAGLYVNYRWFDSLGFLDLFTKTLAAKWLAGLGAGAVIGGVLYANVRLALLNARGEQPLHLYDPDGVPGIDLGQVARKLAIPAALALGALAGLVNHVHWQTALLYWHRTPFGKADPIFGRDVSFYFFELPMWETLASVAFWTLGIAGTAATSTYVMTGAISMQQNGTYLSSKARTHLHILAALLMAVIAAETYLDFYRLMYSTTGPMAGASFADVNARLPALRFKVAFAAVAAALIAANARRQGFALAIMGGALFVTAQIALAAFPAAVQRFSVVPNEFEKERVYLAYNIEATRAAYGLDKVTERDLSGDVQLTREDIANNHATLDNVRLWDHRPLLATFAQIQEIRTYYDFTSVHNDRYLIDGQLRQTMLSPRELSSTSIPNQTWVNERFTFTHGYGLTLGPVNEATPEGLPVLFVQDIPPVSTSPSVKVTRPAIYFGELSNDYVFVRTANREFHYPSGDSFVENDYDGLDGIRFDSTVMRVALAAHLRSLKVLLSNDIDSDSRVLLHRNIMSRVRRVLPFVDFSEHPYMIVREDGTLMWMLDGYLTSSRYPYAEPVSAKRGSINYIRNSVKVTIDAYDGTVSAYSSDAADPLLKTWSKIYPTAFKPMAEMPADVRAHVRYPEVIFRLQAEMFSTYHMDQPQLIYNREDKWEVPAISNNEKGASRMEPYYTVMKLPGETSAEFILMLPFTPSRKDNLSAWMVARADGDHFGELVAYKFPKDRLIFGPQQVVNRINQNAEISRQISLWDQRGSKALFGTLLVIPVERALIYVRPLYLQSEGGRIPELKRVIVAYENRIAMKPSLQEALDELFPEGQALPSTDPTGADQQGSQSEARAALAAGGTDSTATAPEAGAPAAARALHYFNAAIQAQRKGDWAGYGRELERVEQLLRSMQPTPAIKDATGEGPSETTPAP